MLPSPVSRPHRPPQAFARRAQRLVCAALASVFIALGGTAARAQIGSARYASIVIDASNGAILSSVNPDELRFPASLTKMMTLYLLFEALRDRRVGLSDTVPISASAASMAPTKLGLVPGSLITVEQAILGLVTKSANDAAAALGELLGGDEERFAQMMTLRARSLGMTRSTFRNASGLPDWGQVTTAHDMAVLARRLVLDFPGYYHYFSTPSFMFGRRLVRSHQRLLQTYAGADGLKTGYTDASGFNVVTSAVRSDIRLIGVVMGAGSGGERDLHMAGLLDQGFERLGVAPVLARREQPSRMAGMIPSIVSVAHATTATSAVSNAGPLRTAVRQRIGRTPVAERVAARRSVERPAIRTQTAPKPRDQAAQAPTPRPAATRTAHGSAPWRDPG